MRIHQKKVAATVIASVALVSVCGQQQVFADISVPKDFAERTIVSGLNRPTTFAFAPDGRIFIAEQGGAIKVAKNGTLIQNPVVQLGDVNTYNDRGVEGIALDPNFETNGYMYIAYTYDNSPGSYGGPKTGRIIRLTVKGDTADLSTKVVILGTVGGDENNPSCQKFPTTADCIPSDSDTHSMGALRFGPDGKLYATLGDGAGETGVDPQAKKAQDLDSLAGKMVRINPNGTAPADNPFFDGNPNDNRSKVWFLGLRNSYRFNFRPSDSKMFFGDVGWETWEEINIGTRGANYGWPCREGHVATSYDCTPSSTATDPIYVFDHHTGTAAVIGGAFLPASNYPAPYAGNYFFGDYSNDIIKRMVLNSDDSVASVTDFITGAGGPSDIQIGPDGYLYYLALNVGELRSLYMTNGPGSAAGAQTRPRSQTLPEAPQNQARSQTPRAAQVRPQPQTRPVPNQISPSTRMHPPQLPSPSPSQRLPRSPAPFPSQILPHP